MSDVNMYEPTHTWTDKELYSPLYAYMDYEHMNALFHKLDQAKKDYAGKKINTDEFLDIGNKVTNVFDTWMNKYGSQSGQSKALGNYTHYSDLYVPNSKEYQFRKSSYDLLGRDLTKEEEAKARVIYNGQNWKTEGPAYFAQLADQEKQSPDYLKKQAPGYSGQIGSIYQDLLKRGATPDEIDYFGRQLASGNTTPYEVRQFISATPEYQTIQDKSFREGLAKELEGYDLNAFNKEKQNVLSAYSKAGIQNSSALDYAMADLMGEISNQRNQYLSGLSSQQYGGNKAAARSDYENYLNQYLGEKNYQRQRNDQYLDYLTQRAGESTDYQRQMSDYLNYLNSQPKRRGVGLGSSLGSLLGAGIGAIGAGAVTGGMGAGQGAMLGSYLGNSGGGLFDYFNY